MLFGQLLQTFGQAQYHPACRSLSFAIVSSLTVLCFLMSNRQYLLRNASYMPLRWCGGQQRTTMTRHRFFHLWVVSDVRVATCTVTDSSMSRAFAAHCAVPLNLTCTIVRVFGRSRQERSVGDRHISPLSIACHQRRHLANSFFIFVPTHAAVLLLPRSSMLKICTI